MKKEGNARDQYEDKIDNLKAEDFEKVIQEFRKRIHYDFAAWLNTCAHCGLCADACHYYLTYKDPESIPGYKLNLVTKVFKKHFGDTASKAVSAWIGAEELNKKVIREWADSLFGRCSLCGRCAINCTMGINIPYIIRAARGAMAAVDLVPPGLQSTVNTAIEKGNNMGIAKEDWLETIEWLEDELRQEVNDPQAELPLDKKGAELLYTINPREAQFFPMSILAAGKIFYAAGESWTFSSDYYDVTNYGLYSGDDHVSGVMSKRLVETLRELECKKLILTECGHGFNSNRWEAPEWLSMKYGFDVRSILQVVADYIQKGRIKVDPSLNKKVMTLHDPCNLVRLGGIVEEQRYILRNVASHFVEMTPNREKNYCCGGGGGQLAMTRFAKRRIEVGKLKADQIRKTGAEIVVAPCHNCIDQLLELNKHCKLGVEIKTVCEVVADALVIKKKKQD